MGDNIRINTTGRLTPCLQQKIDKTRNLDEVHFLATSTQSVEDKLKRVILHDIEHGKQGKTVKVMKNDEYVLDKLQQGKSKVERSTGNNFIIEEKEVDRVDLL